MRNLGRELINAPGRTICDVRFSNRPFGVKRFQTIHHCNVGLLPSRHGPCGLPAVCTGGGALYGALTGISAAIAGPEIIAASATLPSMNFFMTPPPVEVLIIF